MKDALKTNKKSNLSQVLNKFETNMSYESVKDIASSDDIVISIANNLEDRIQAYRLLYEVYVEKEFARPNTSKMWYSKFDASAGTITFVAKKEGLVVGALTVIKDSKSGLPVDSIYKKEVDLLRNQAFKLSEIVSLGIKKNVRGAHKILVRLFEYAYCSAKSVQPSSHFVITINPKHLIFYEKKLLFEIQGQVRVYSKVGGAEAVLLQLGLGKVTNILSAEFTKKPTLYDYFSDSTTRNSIINKLESTHSKMSTAEVKYFFTSMENKSNESFSQKVV